MGLQSNVFPCRKYVPASSRKLRAARSPATAAGSTPPRETTSPLPPPARRVRAIRDARGGERAGRRAGGGSGLVVSRGGVDPAAVAGERAARSLRDEAGTYFRQGNTFA